MIETGILDEDENVELLEGWVVPKMSRGPVHDTAVWLTHKKISSMLPPEWICRSQLGVTTADSEPEPDVAVVRGPGRRYVDHHPAPEEMAQAIEVAKSSLHRDRTLKARIFARAGVPVYWIINLVDDQIEVYTDSSGPGPAPGYRQRQDYGPGMSVPLVIENHEIGRIPVSDLLP